MRIIASGAMLDHVLTAAAASHSSTMIPAETLAQVAAANDIVDVIGSKVPLKRAGTAYKALCPFHREKSPSFTVNPIRQTFHCFGCGVGGGVFKFLTLIDNIDFPSAVRQLAERAHITIVEEDRRGAGGDDRQSSGEIRRRLLALHADAAAWFHRNLMKAEGATPARAYLRSRGLSAEVAARWQLGYAPASWDACAQWAAASGYTAEELALGGLSKTPEPEEGDAPRRAYDRFRDRLMFPICDVEGKVIAFSGRVLEAEVSAAKYLNSPETPLFTKGKVLFGLHLAKRDLLAARTAIVCEGQIDLITAFEAGIKNVTAPQGTAFTERQAVLLKRHVDEVVLCFDADGAGQRAAERSLLPLLQANLAIRVASMPPGEDPDTLIRKHGAAAFQAQIAAGQDFFDFQLERSQAQFDATTPGGRVQIARQMAEAVSLLTDHVWQEAVIGTVSSKLGYPREEFRLLVGQQRTGALRRFHADLAGPGLLSGGEASAPAETFSKPPIAISNLLKLAVEHDEARAWLQEQPWRERLPRIGGADLLLQALSSQILPSDTASVSAFMAALPAAAESFLAGLMMDKPFPQPMLVARDSWRGLEKGLVLERRTALESRMRLPDLSFEESTQLQKEILDLQQRLQDIAQP